ncbi:MAG: tyrosine-type recombinase/integrase [Chloroflexota bacterium]|nr:tyrosine-type recombinase/integrase [Chloroflexota bacterium]
MPPLERAPAAPLAAIASAAITSTLATNPAAVYLAQLAKGSRRTMASSLGTLAQLLGYADALACPWAQLRYQHTTAIRAQLMDTYAPATANRMLAALRRVLQEAWRLELMTAEEYRRAADLTVIKEQKLPSGRALAADEVLLLLDACAADSTPAGVRDSALIAVLIGTGLRRSEVVALDVSDYERSSGALKVRSGKGRKDRLVYATGGVLTALADWLTVRGSDAGALFVAATRGGHIGTRRMTDQAVRVILEKRATQAGVADFSPHDLRRTMITGLLDAGADIATVQKLAGHADPATTARYDRRGEATKRDAAALLDVPHTPRRTLPLDEP